MASYAQRNAEDIKDARDLMEVMDGLPRKLRRAFQTCRYGYSLEAMRNVRAEWESLGADKVATEFILRKLRTRERARANEGTGA